MAAEVREIAYEENPDFNSEFDELNEGLTVGEVTLAPSWMLYNTDYDLYLTALDEYNNRIFEDLKSSIQNNYSPIIAFNFRLSERGEGAEDPVKKLLHLKDTWEAIIFTLYALTMGEVRKKGIDCKTAQILQNIDSATGNPNYRNFNTNWILTDALKNKIKVIKAIIKHSQNNSLDFNSEYIPIELLDELIELQSARNDISHHASPTRQQAEQELRTIQPIFETMIKRTKFLENCNIYRFNNLDSSCRCEVFSGHSLNKEFGRLELTGDNLSYIIGLSTDTLFAEWEGEYFSLSPFLHYKEDEIGHESYICFFKGKREGQYWYEPVKIRTELSFDALQTRFETEKDELVNLLVP